MKISHWLLTILLAGLLLGSLTAAGILAYFSQDLPDVSTLKDVRLQTPMQIFSKDGKLMSQYGEKRRIPLTLEQIPQQMIDAFLAVEDARFYEHPGIDLIGVARAFVTVIIAGDLKQGASTITMQLARNFFLTREKTFQRKIKEILLAWRIEKLLTKDQILELYLNKIFLGYRAYGVGAAAEVYFGKTVSELTLSEIAVIAGLPKAPSTKNPIHSVENATSRRNVVLARMMAVGYIDRPSYVEAVKAPLEGKYHQPSIELNAPYVAEMIRLQMVERYGDEAATTHGFKVYSTVDSKIQQAAINAVVENLHDYDQRHGYRGALANPWLVQVEGEDEPVLQRPSQWGDEQAQQALEKYSAFQGLLPAMVEAVTESSASIWVKAQKKGVISWDDMKWARPFITDEQQGPAPKSAEEILQPGDIILVKATPDEGGYTLSQEPSATAALVALNPKNGAIEALVGGYSFAKSQFNRAWQAKRQLGSNIKPFIYSAALESGYTLASLVPDAPISHWDASAGVIWRPKNSPEVYDGDTRLRLGLAKSKNVMSVRLLRALGIETIRQHLARFGFPLDDIPPNESLALGSASLAPMTVVRAYAVLANGGFRVNPYLVDRIEDRYGNRLLKHQPKVACTHCEREADKMENDLESLIEEAQDHFAMCPHQPVAEKQQAPRVISPQNAFLVTQAMNSAIWGGGNWNAGTGWNGTGWRAARALKRHDIAGKTGTTNDARDAWFSGFHPSLVATSWIGFDDHRRKLGQTKYNPNLGKSQITGKEFGAKTALPAWIKFMQVALKDQPKQNFTVPDNIVSVRIDRASGLLSQVSDHTSRFEYFIAGSEPTRFADIVVTPSTEATSDEVASDPEGELF